MMGFLSGSREAERRGRSADVERSDDVERTWLLPGHRLPRREFLTAPADNPLFQKISKQKWVLIALKVSKVRYTPAC
jgi:hypothetical protein